VGTAAYSCHYFTGRRVDILDNGSLKIQYNRNRYYDYYTGRWLTQDPLGINPTVGTLNHSSVSQHYTDGMSLYEYVRSCPLIRTDPQGLITLACCKELLPKVLGKPPLEALYKKAKTKTDAKGRPCLKRIKCKKCKPGVMGYYKKRKIVACAHEGPGCNLKKFVMYVKHELIHAIVKCGSEFKDCKDCMIQEKQAYYWSGFCFSDSAETGCTKMAWDSCTKGWKPPCDTEKETKEDYLGVGWPP
jgi:RHS repeat-associated protein